MTDTTSTEPTAGERAALAAVLLRAESSPDPIPLWRLNDSGLTAAELKAALGGLAARGCIRATYRAGLVETVTDVLPEARELGKQWGTTQAQRQGF